IPGEARFHVPVAIAPGAELLDDPRGGPGRRIIETVCERLRLGPLNPLIAGLAGSEFLHLREERLLFRSQLNRPAALRRCSADHVDVDAVEMIRIDLADSRGDCRAPVAALHREALEPEHLRHQLEEQVGYGLDVHRADPRMIREAVARQGWRYHRE